MASIRIDGVRYRVVADFGFLDHYNLYARRVAIGKDVRVAVHEPGKDWRWWDEYDATKAVSINKEKFA